MNNALALPLVGMEIDRSRRPAKYTLTAVLMVFVMFVSGWACNVQSWISNINTILAEVAPAVQIVVSLLPLLGTQVPPNVTTAVNAWVPKIQKDVTDLGNLIQQYQNDLSTNTTAQAAINSLITTTQQDVLSILPDFNVFDANTQAKIVSVVNIIAAAVTSVENIINRIEGKVTAKAAPGAAKLVKNGKDFKNQFNANLRIRFGASAPQLA